MVAEIVSGLFFDLINSGFKRGVSVLFQKIGRLQRIDQATRGAIAKNPLVKAALDDFEVVIGSYQGDLTITLNEFIHELSRTGIVDSMVENALIVRASPEVKKVFIDLHFNFFGSTHSGDQLYENMMNAFSITIRELSKDPVLLSMIQAISKDLNAKLEKIDESLQMIELNMGKRESSNITDIISILTKISKALQSSYKTVRVETNRGARDVDINRIYIPPKLSLRDNPTNDRISNAFIKASRNPNFDSHRRHQQNYHYFFKEENNTIAYGELLGSFKRIVVLGDPGGGKSTLCQRFCYDMAKDSFLALQYKPGSKIPSSQQKLPIRVILRKFEQARTTDPQLDLLTYISKDIVNYAGGEIGEIKSAILYILDSGRAALAFDGLDEILDTSKRQEFVDLVVALCNRHPLCPVLITSRLVGYDSARLPDDFEELVLQKFDDYEVETYIRKFMSVVGEKTKEESKLLATQFMIDTSSTAYDLRKNPLLLGLMGWLFLASGDVPSNRPEIYKECSTLMFERWDQRRGIVADTTSDFDRSQLFITLASNIYGQPELSAGVGKDWLEATFRQSFLEIYEDKVKAFITARTFVSFITGRAWVMSEVGDNIFAFTHQTFLEYFFARHLDDRHDSVVDLLKSLKPRIIKHEWNEVSHLALQLKTHRSLRKQEEAIQHLQLLIRLSKLPRQQSALMGFAGRALEYLTPSEATINSFISELSEIAISRASSGDHSSMVFLGFAGNSARERNEYVNSKISSILQRTVLEPDYSRSRVAAKMLSSHINYYFDKRRSTSIDFYLPVKTRKQSIDELKEKILYRASDNELFSALSWCWYGEISGDLIEKFGLAAIYNHPHLDAIEGLNGLCAMAIAATGRYRKVSRSFEISPDSAQSALAIIGKFGPQKIPVDRNLFEVAQFAADPPDHIWLTIYNALKTTPDALAGAVLARWVTAASLRPDERIENHRKLGRISPSRAGSVLQKIEENLVSTNNSFSNLQKIISGKLRIFS